LPPAHVAIVARPSTDLADAVADLRSSRPQAAEGHRSRSGSQDRRLAGLATSLVLAAGTVDILVNNAAIIGPIGPLDRTEDRDWAEAIHVNLLAPIALMRAVLPGMRRRRHGKVINISGGGAAGSRPNFTAYACAKTALVRATEIVSDEVKDSGIDINAVAPGAMNTRLFDQVLAAGADRVGVAEFERALKQRQRRLPPLGGRSCGLAGVGKRRHRTALERDLGSWESLASHRDELARSDDTRITTVHYARYGKDYGRKT
jgi:3-oxoacyl-[acyl-carrier protein] reductase